MSKKPQIAFVDPAVGRLAWVKFGAIVILSAPCAAQSVDAAVEVKEGSLASLAADFEVGVVTGISASLQDEKWYITGACSNRPTVSIGMKSGLTASLMDRTVGIVSNLLSADRVICITNVESLSDDLKEKLGLIEE